MLGVEEESVLEAVGAGSLKTCAVCVWSVSSNPLFVLTKRCALAGGST